MSESCKTCDGSGWIEGRNCPSCNHDHLSLRLPACFSGQPGIYHCHAMTCDINEKATCPLLVHPGKDHEAVWDEVRGCYITGRPIV